MLDRDDSSIQVFIANYANYTNYANKKGLYEKEILFVSFATRVARIRVIRDY
jgi:hypothetical protein